MGVSIEIAIRGILEILFLLGHPNIFCKIFYIFSPRENSREPLHNSSAPSNEDMILGVIQIHQDS